MAEKPRRPQKPNATGRNNTSRFVRLDYRLLNCPAYRSLSPNARSLLVELIMLFNGVNNGSLYLSVEDAAHRMGVADHHAASRAFNELQALGFIEMTNDAHFSIKASNTSRARTWRLAWEAGPGRKAPSWNFRELEPAPGTPERRRMERGLRALKRYMKDRSADKYPVVDSTSMDDFHSNLPTGAMVDSTMLQSGNGGNLQKGRMVDSPHHIATTMGSCTASAAADQIGGIET